MKDHFKKIIESIGENPEREGLLKTPQRAANAMRFLTQGYQQSLDDIVNNALFETASEELIILKNIELYSLCEHHLLPFAGKCHVGYLPKGKIIGLSKIARIVEMFARRLQVQERLTMEIAEALMNVTGCQGVGVVIEARHFCMMMRGVEKQNSVMTTSAMLGALRTQQETRAEFLTLIRTP